MTFTFLQYMATGPGQGAGRGISRGISKIVGYGTPNFGIEIVYSFVVILTCLIVYFSTKEIYQLSKHKGIGHFRSAFLFFALAYFFRYFAKFLFREVIEGEFGYSLFVIVEPLSLFLFVYFGAISLFSLFYSVSSKKLGKVGFGTLQMISLTMALITVIFRNPVVYLVINIILASVGCLTGYFAYENMKKKKGSKHLYIIYLLLSLVWVLNLVDILIPNFFVDIQIIIYLVSISLFITILYKVTKHLGPS